MVQSMKDIMSADELMEALKPLQENDEDEAERAKKYRYVIKVENVTLNKPFDELYAKNVHDSGLLLK